MSKDIYKKILKQYWGYTDFRGIQYDIIQSISSGRDTLGLMPTGGGKSITFQVPALLMEGVCIVITPLIALIKDQVDLLKQKGIQASSIYSGMSHSTIVTTLDNCIFGGVKLLYISPERLSSEIFQKKLKKMKISFITVDEAHCISQWGYDFRPSYLSISKIRELKPKTAILALTATAPKIIVEDIQKQLHFRENNVFKMSFERKNLAYIVRNSPDKITEIIHILKSVDGTAIIYVRSRKRTQEIAHILNSKGISATAYHAGLEDSIKNERQNQWKSDKIRVMVATNAFGMGIDKANVRLVIHKDCPDSIEAYFQEAGRAGRDGEKSYAILLWDSSDKKKLNRRIKDNFPEKKYIKQVYEHLAYFLQIGLNSGKGYTFLFDRDLFCNNFKHFPTPVESSLQILNRSGYIKYEQNPDTKARLKFLLRRDELYKLDDATKNEELVVTALLRCYGGLFTDYNYIEEALIAQEAGLDRELVYSVLKSLSQRKILSFIPRSHTPRITYTRDRINIEHIVIPKEIYDIRKEQYIKRISSIYEYATSNNICRSRLLLKYFNENRSKDCEICDVCINHSNKNKHKNKEIAIQQIKELLSDKKPHNISEIHTLNINSDTLRETIKHLENEEFITSQGATITLIR